MIWIVLTGLALIGFLVAKYWYVPFLRNPDRIDLQTLGFKLTTVAHKQRVRDILTAFFNGFNAMLMEKQMASVRARCDSFPRFLRPFAHEGAAMAFGIKTLMAPWRRIRDFDANMQNLSREFYLMYYIGLGFCAGMVSRFWPSGVRHIVGQLHSFYKYLCYDGFGFEAGLFGYLKNPNRVKKFSRFEGYARHVCFQGFGRSLWFLFMDATDLITETIALQETPFRGDCYSGLGLAVTFTNMDDLRVPFEFSKEVEREYLADYFLGVTIALYTRREIDALYFNECLQNLDPWQRSFVRAGLQSCDCHFVTVSAMTTENHYKQWRQEIAADLKSILAPQAASTAS
jgi:enediyne biosynthesis protein E3